MTRKLVEEAIAETNINNAVKRWTILDRKTGEMTGLTDNAFSDGVKKEYIELRGQFVQNKRGYKVWIDGIFK